MDEQLKALPAYSILVIAPPSSALADALGAAVTEMGGSLLRVSTLEDAIGIMQRLDPEPIAVEVGRRFEQGTQFVRCLRVLTAVPIIALGSDDGGEWAARAMEAGANDCLTTIPRSATAFKAYLEALQRQSGQIETTRSPVARIRDLAVDLDRCEASIGQNRLNLTPTEFRLLALLARHAGRVLSAQRLMSEAQDYALPEAEARAIVKVHLRRLRAKMKPLEGESPYIITVRGFGYMLERRAAPRPDDVLAGYVQRAAPELPGDSDA